MNYDIKEEYFRGEHTADAIYHNNTEEINSYITENNLDDSIKSEMPEIVKAWERQVKIGDKIEWFRNAGWGRKEIVIGEVYKLHPDQPEFFWIKILYAEDNLYDIGNKVDYILSLSHDGVSIHNNFSQLEVKIMNHAKQKLQEELEELKKEYKNIERKIIRKECKLEKQLQKETGDLFTPGENKDTMFGTEPDPNGIKKAIEPMARKRDAIKRHITKVRKKINLIPNEPDPELNFNQA